MLLRIVRALCRLVLHVVANVETINFDRIPSTGGCVVAANHLGRLDAALAIILANRDDVILLIAEKYQQYAFWRWVARELDAIWLNRFEVDFHALRQVYKRLRQGELLAMAPEGTRSQTEALLPGRPGAAYLAYRAGVPIVPVAISGTEDRVVKDRLRRFRRLDVTISVGEPFILPSLNGQDRDLYLAQQTEEIMCRIAALLPPQYRGVYADHPRVQELLKES